MYPPELTKPMAEELVNAGFTQLSTTQAVDEEMKKEGTALVVVNSVCGCAAGRPAKRPASRRGSPPAAA